MVPAKEQPLSPHTLSSRKESVRTKDVRFRELTREEVTGKIPWNSNIIPQDSLSQEYKDQQIEKEGVRVIRAEDKNGRKIDLIFFQIDYADPSKREERKQSIVSNYPLLEATMADSATKLFVLEYFQPDLVRANGILGEISFSQEIKSNGKRRGIQANRPRQILAEELQRKAETYNLPIANVDMANTMAFILERNGLLGAIAAGILLKFGVIPALIYLLPNFIGVIDTNFVFPSGKTIPLWEKLGVGTGLTDARRLLGTDMLKESVVEIFNALPENSQEETQIGIVYPRHHTTRFVHYLLSDSHSIPEKVIDSVKRPLYHALLPFASRRTRYYEMEENDNSWRRKAQLPLKSISHV